MTVRPWAGSLLMLLALTTRLWAAEPPQNSTATAVAVSTQASGVSVSSGPAGVSASTGPTGSGVAVSSEPEHEAVEPPRPWVIGQIEVSGTINVKPSVIKSTIRAKKGDLYDRPDLDRDVQSLLGLGQFERVAADIVAGKQPVPEHYKAISGSPNTIVLTFLIKEKPLIKKIRYKGNDKVGKGALGDVVTLKNKDPLDIVKLHEDEGKVLDKYHERGFLDAQVRSEVTLDTATLQAFIDFVIVEGPKSKISEVVVDGIKAFKPKKILKLMKNRRKKVYVAKELPEDLKKVETHYKNNGYLDVTVSSATVNVSEDKTKIAIHFSVVEGPQYRHGDTSFNGNTVYTSTDLARALEYRKGKVFNQERFDESIRGIQELYADKGYLKARVTPKKTLNETTKLMDVDFGISEATLVYIDHVDLEGNKATKTHVLRRELTVKPGDVFSASKVRRSRDRIMNLGFIDDVDVDIQGTEDPDKVDLTFDVAEGKPGLLTAGAAYSSVDGFIGTLSMSHLNLFGRAQQAKVEWQFGRRVQDFFISWRTPWIYNSPTSLGFDVFNTRRILPFETSNAAYVKRERGGTIHVGPRFKEDKYQLGISYTFSQIQITNVQDIFQGVIAQGTSNYSSISLSFARDTRDNIWDPTEGSRHSIGLQLAGGPLKGDIHFFTPSLSNFAHKKLFSINEWPFVLTFANRLAYVTQFGETKTVPVQNRFFLGGQDTMRGYAATGEVGFPSGGKVMEIFNVEFGFPLARERRKTLVKLVTFFDLGTTWDKASDVHLRMGTGQRDLKADAGIGIRFTTPAFPIRLDWGYGFHHKPGERLYQVNFGLGNLF
jgi:outer membrane protein insertion porin family